MKAHYRLQDMIVFSLFFLLFTCKKSETADFPVKTAQVSGSNTVLTTTTTTVATTPVSSVPLVLNGISNRIITGLDISGNTANCITLTNCSNISIQSCTLHSSKGYGVYLYNCKNITVTNCFIYSVATGVCAVGGQTIVVSSNQFQNILGPKPRGQMVQFNKVTGAGNLITSNKCESIAGLSNPEDVISIYQSSGTAASPILITSNWIRGGGPSTTGGGIMLGDAGGAYITAESNILVNPGQYGIAISSGTNIKVISNKIYGKQQIFTNIGLYVWNQYTVGCSLNTVSSNQVKWFKSTGIENDSWNEGNCGVVSGWSTNIWKAKIDSTILPVKIITATPFYKL